ncbi:MAG: PilZ domain-containing protein [Planctomycetota bacterium]
MERRTTPRFVTPPMFHPVALRPVDADSFVLDGDACDLSTGGAQIEVDEPMAPGTVFGIRIDLPAGFDSGPGRAVFATGRVAWCFDPMEEGEGESGCIRIGIAIETFSRTGDAERLQRYLTSMRLRAAA